MRFPLATVPLIILSLLAVPASALVITEQYTTDFIELYSCGYQLSVDRHPTTIGTFAAPQWNVLVNNEPVYVIAHGAQGSIGTHNPMNGAQLAAWIGSPAWYTTTFYITSCESAIGTSTNPSLITAAADASRATRTFTGFAGCAIVDAPRRIPRVVLPFKTGTLGTIQANLVALMHPQAQIDQFVVNYRASHGGADPSLLLLAQTAYGNVVIRNFYAELLKQGGQQGCFYDVGQGSVTKKGKLPAAKKPARRR
jgi:hypothetical protein